jgi:hypothetical protein
MNMFQEEQSKEDKIKLEAKAKYGVHFNFFEQAGKELNWLEENNPTFAKKNKVCIIGNGLSLLSKKAGEAIDKFDYVCRVDDFVTPVEKTKFILGSKTTHVVHGASPLASAWSKGRVLPRVSNILLIPADQFTSMQAWLYYFCGKNGSLFDSTPLIKLLLLERLGIENIEQQDIWKNINSHDLYDTNQNWNFVSLALCREIANKTVEYPSVGISTIFYFRYILNWDVSVIGFDFEDKHICEELTKDIKAPMHEKIDYTEESVVFDEWVGNKIIKLL